MKKRQVAQQMAVIHETITLETLKPNTGYESVVSLDMFSRATDMADNFQEYRIAKLVYKYTPLFDTYLNTTVTPSSVPYLYTKRHVTPAPATFNLDYLKALGAKPRRLDDKTLNQSYTPNVVQFVNTSTYTQTTPPSVLSGLKPIFKPWLTTYQNNPLVPAAPAFMDKTEHFGHAFWLDQGFSDALNICELEVTAYFEFRKPWDKPSSQSGKPTIRLGKKVVVIE